jgi:hypothetical protein
MDDLERLAARVGVTPEQARELLAASQPPPQPSPSPRREALNTRVLDGATWAGAIVALGSVATFLTVIDAFNGSPDGKGAALIVGLVCVAVAGTLAQAASRGGYRLGQQLGWSTVAIVSPLIAWSLLWALGLWPGAWQVVAGYGNTGGYWTSGSDEAEALAVMIVSAVPLAVGVAVVRATGAGLALGVALLAAHFVVVAFLIAIDVGAPGEGLSVFLSAVYAAAFLAAAMALERTHRPWATWVHPFAIGGMWGVVSALDAATGSGPTLFVGAFLLAGGATLCVLLRRSLYLVSTLIGGATWEFALHHELSLGPVGALVLSLTLGLGAIAIAVTAFRRRPPTAFA